MPSLEEEAPLLEGEAEAEEEEGPIPLCSVKYEKKYAHPARKCYHVYDVTFQPQPHRPLSSKPPSQASSNDHALISTSPNNTNAHTWYIDTGATAHVTDYPSYIQ